MIIEMRSYQLKPGNVPEFEKRFGDKLPGRLKFSPLAALWHTEVGPLNTMIHVWPYASIEERTRIRAEAVKAGAWPPDTHDLINEMQSEIYIPAPFSPALEPRSGFGIYEIRKYTYAPQTIPAVIEAWSKMIEARVKLSPLIGAWYSELGALNRWCHIWAYKDANERAQVRAKAVAEGLWPPKSPPGALLKMENMLVVPAACSPLK